MTTATKSANTPSILVTALESAVTKFSANNEQCVYQAETCSLLYM